jgi:xanthine dehydrogenase YagR molybdenum-binding subunit
MTSVGTAVDRVDGARKVTGTAPYAADHPLPDLAYAVLVQSTIGTGRITAIDTRVAEAAPGVLAVLTHANAPTMRPTEVFDPASPVPKAAATSAAILQTDRVYWNGQPVAVVVADTFEEAWHAAHLVTLTYDERPARVSLETERAHAALPDNVVGEPAEVRKGDAETALDAAVVTVDRLYTTPRENHNPIEPHATIAAWQDDRLTVYDATQYVFGVREMLAETFAVPADDVRVVSRFVGGGFGGKGLAWPHVALAAVAARVVGRPVKLALSREQMYGGTGYRTPTEQRVALGADREGRLTAVIHTGVTPTSTTNTFTEQFTFPARHLYACPNILVRQQIVRLDVGPPTFMRAPGETPGTYALESAVDELAYALNLDPIELRLRNQPDRDPTTGAPFSSRHLEAAYRLGAEKFGWSRRTPEPRSMRDGYALLGLGVATAFYPVYRFPAAARARIQADGRALIQSGTHEMGMGTATAQSQVAADRLGLPVEHVTFEYGDTSLPFAPVTGGSSTTVSVGAAVQAACDAVKSKLVALVREDGASPLRGLGENEIRAREAGLFHTAEAGRGETYQAILARHHLDGIEATAHVAPGDEAERFSMHSSGAQFAEVRVDPDLGEVRVTRFVGVFDCGRIVNPKTARSQLLGGITMGLGMALMEHTDVDRATGRVTNPNLAEYLLPTHADTPAIEVYFLDRPDPQTPVGAHGLGELGITGVAAAVANAVFHATERRIRDLPILPEKLLEED